MARCIAATLVLGLLVNSGPAPAVTFESWEDAVASGSTRENTTKEASGQPAPGGQVTTSVPAARESKALIRFGAGATYLVPVRPGDFATGERVMSEFSVSLNFFRSVVEVGADLAMSRDSTFFIRPNLKLILGDLDFAFFLEGFLALYSHPDGLELGGGGGVGAVTGIIDNLALEVFAAVMVFDMSAPAAASLVHGGFLGDGGEPGSRLFIPYAGARLVARF